MIRVAIVEDEPECQELLAGCLGRYGKENGEEFSVERFSDGAELVEFYRPVWDIVFLDIEMERLDGMNAARLIRKSDECVAIIFVTRLANYAVQGFDVNALDFIVKPFTYRNFALKMNKAVRYVRQMRGKTVQLKTADAVFSVPVSDILYVEAQGHDIIYHTYDREYHTWQTLKTAMDLLGELVPKLGKFLSKRHACAKIRRKWRTLIRVPLGFAGYFRPGPGRIIQIYILMLGSKLIPIFFCFGLNISVKQLII